MAVAVVSLPR
jgi:hypothetical protein